MLSTVLIRNSCPRTWIEARSSKCACLSRKWCVMVMVVVWQDVTGRSSQGLQCARTLFGIVWCCQNRVYGHNQSFFESPVPMQKIREPKTLNLISESLLPPKDLQSNWGAWRTWWNPRGFLGRKKSSAQSSWSGKMLPELPSLNAGVLCIFLCTIAKSQSQRHFWHSLGRCSFFQLKFSTQHW